MFSIHLPALCPGFRAQAFFLSFLFFFFLGGGGGGGGEVGAICHK